MLRQVSFLFLFLLLLSGCTSEEGENGPSVVPYFEDEQFSPFTGELERYVAPQPDSNGFASQRYAVSGLSCPGGKTPRIVTFSWNNPASNDVYLAGSPSGPVAHYRTQNGAVFNISARVEYVCEGRTEIAEVEAGRKKLMLYYAEEGILYSQEARATCPGEYFLSKSSERDTIEKAVPVGVDSGEGWIVSAYRLEVAEPYDYPLHGCGKYSEHWTHTYLRETTNGSSCSVGECRGPWYTFRCPSEEGEPRIEMYAGKNCASVSQIKDFRSVSEWYDLMDNPEFPSPGGEFK